MKPSLTHSELLEIADHYGTPVYVYHGDMITHQYEKLVRAFQGHPTRIFYACKALTNLSILRHLKKLGSSVDCVSLQEVKLALLAGFDPQEILFTPNCVDLSEIEAGKELGVHINIDNISILEQFGNRHGSSYPICIRINPHIEAGGNYKISTGHIDSKFGISVHQMRHIERIVHSTGIQVKGLHMHTGSEIKEVEIFLRGLDVMFEMARHFPSLDFIDLGSGFKVPYQTGDPETDVNLLGQKLREAVKEFEKEYGRPLEVWFEPGKFLVSEAGYFITRVNIVKQTPATVFAGLNSGFNHLLRPMFYEAYHRIENISNPLGKERIYTVVGNICETDTFAWDRKLTEIREGDLLVFYNAGAYGFEMSSRFNSRLRPAEVLVLEGKAGLIRRRETFDDLLVGQVPFPSESEVSKDEESDDLKAGAEETAPGKGANRN